LVDTDGSQLGVVSVSEALKLAEAKGVDLVEIAPTADPPVCKIMDYGKFRYQEKKRAHEAKKKQVVVTVKEVKMRSRTDEHDLEYKVRNIRQFLDKAHRVKVSVFFRGREIAHPDLGREMLNGIFERVQDIARMDSQARLEGRSMSMFLSPR
jgi:translation initiation factor IF-3